MRIKIKIYELILDLIEWRIYRPAFKNLEAQAKHLNEVKEEIYSLLDDIKLKPEESDG